MSTAAPAAPAASGPASAASATPATATPGAQPSQTGAQPEQAAAPRTIKPIPPRPKLPGVMEDGPEPATERPPRDVSGRERDASGRFVAGEQTQGKPKPQALDAADGIPPLPGQEPAEPPKPKFKFAGKEYDSQEAAEHDYRSVIGRQRALAETEGHLVKAAESARGWHAEAQRLQAELAALQAGQVAQPEPAPIVNEQGIDWALYAEIRRVAAEAGTPEKADQWLHEQYQSQWAAREAALREELSEPWREQQAQAQLVQTADTLVESMAAHTNPDGSPTFPEFRDGNQAREVGALWQSLGLDPRLALTPGGAVAAVALYRMAQGMNTPAPIAPTPAAPPAPAPDPAALAAASLEGGRPLVPPASRTGELVPEAARIVQGIRGTQLTRPGLGFGA